MKQRSRIQSKAATGGADSSKPVMRRLAVSVAVMTSLSSGATLAQSGSPASVSVGVCTGPSAGTQCARVAREFLEGLRGEAKSFAPLNVFADGDVGGVLAKTVSTEDVDKILETVGSSNRGILEDLAEFQRSVNDFTDRRGVPAHALSYITPGLNGLSGQESVLKGLKDKLSSLYDSNDPQPVQLLPNNGRKEAFAGLSSCLQLQTFWLGEVILGLKEWASDDEADQGLKDEINDLVTVDLRPRVRRVDEACKKVKSILVEKFDFGSSP